MISKGHKHLVQSVADLPQLPEIHDLYCDVETTAFDDKVEAFHPYMGHRICGISLTVDDCPDAWYVPIRHIPPDRWNVELEPVLAWWQGILSRARRWINHNVKFDARFADAEGMRYDHLELVDTLILAKGIDSDRMNHSLKPLLRDWLGISTETEDAVERYLKGIKSKDYAAVPADIMAWYGCDDVTGVRALHRYAISRSDGDLERVWKQEIALTPVLLDMERDGLRVHVLNSKIESVKTIRRILAAQERVHELTGVELKDSSDCYYEALCTQFGLPVLARTDKTDKGGGGNPSFDKETMLLYSALPAVVTNPLASEVVKCIQTFKTESTFKGLFLDSLLEKRDKADHVHPIYNQLVRTGRMSCSDPNGQQFNKRAKHLLVPECDEVFFCSDASQIEFRVIVHYCKNQRAIAAYAANPLTDYHQWVAELCGIDRKPAKTVNFAMAYGAGRARVTSQLGNEESIVKAAMEQVALITDPIKRAQAYDGLLTRKAEEIYETYHAELPELRRTAEYCRGLAAARGFIKNKYGRKRHLATKAAHKAFNSMVQGCAMDIIKERMIALSQRNNSWMRENGIRLRANVHDELLLTAPREVARDPATMERINATLEDVQVHFDVPIRWNTGWSEVDWQDAKDDGERREKAHRAAVMSGA